MIRASQLKSRIEIIGSQAGFRRIVAKILLPVSCLFVSPAFAQFEIPVVKFNVKAFVVEGDNPLGVEKSHEVLKEFLGAHVGIEGLQAAADELEAELAKAGHSFHRVILPPQRALGGEVKLQVVAFSLGKITVAGNKHFSEENILESVPGLRPEQIPNEALIGEQIEFANEHPSKKVAVTFKDSEETDAVDATLQVQDVDPVQIYTMLSNTGAKATGRGRLSIGFLHGNVHDTDHQVSFSYTTSPGHWEDVHQAGLNYKVPLYGQQTDVSFSVTYSDVDSGQVAGLFDVTGRGLYVGAKVHHTLPKRGSYRHSVSLSLDDKYFDNNVGFGGTPVGADVASRPLSLNYAASYVQPKYNVSLSFDYVYNIDSGEDNDQAAYTATRAGATPDWEVYKLSLAGEYVVDNWAIKARASAQFTDNMLISGEQFGFGGSAGPRGLDEREVSGDEGYAWTVEIWSPKIRETVNVIGFYDHGNVRVHNATVGTNPRESVDSAGLGLRAAITETTSLSLDWGKVLNGSTTTVEGDSRIHGSLFHRF